jgi:hypothetical protein
LDRSKKILLSVLLVTIIATASSSLFSANPTVYVNPWMDTYYRYEKIDNHWVTHNSVDNSTMPGLFMPVNCKNNGATVAEFNITVSFSGSSFSADTPHPYQQLNSTAASFEFILKVGEQQTVPVYFTIDKTINHFIITLSIETDQNNLFVEPIREESTFYGYKQLFYVWVAEYNVYAPVLIE